MPGLNPTRTNVLLLVVLLVGQLLLMTGSVRNPEGSTLLQSGAMRFSAPVVSTARAVSGGVGGMFGSVRRSRSTRAENEQLREQNETLRRELERTREAALENERLRRLLGMRDDFAPESIGARVVTTNFTTQTQMIVVDRGTEHGVRPDLPVLGWGGAVGRVVFAGKDFAKIRLLSDPNSGAAAIVQRSRVEGIVLGRGEAPLEMEYVPEFSDVVAGDRLVTSGHDGVFPKGLGIGRVSEVVEGRVSKRIRVVPEVDYTSLEEVLVLLEPRGGLLLGPPENEGEAP